MISNITAYFDGYGRAKDRDYCMYSVAVRCNDEDVIRFDGKLEEDLQTSQIAEYFGAIQAAKWCNEKYSNSPKLLRGDSKLVINQQGTWRTKEPHLIPLRDELKSLLNGNNWTLEWVSSKRNYADLRKFRGF